MYRFKKLVLIAAGLILFIPFLCFPQANNISYYLEIDEQNWNSFHVRITVENVTQPYLVFVMPVWRPGVYVRQDFGQYVQNFKAFGESALPLTTIKLNRAMWHVESNNSSIVRVEYDVDYSSRRFIKRSLDSNFAIVDGAMNFMYIKGRKHLPSKVNIRVPHGWKLATSLPSGRASFEYIARNYDHLIDCPMLMSKFKEYYFTLNDRPFNVIIDGKQNFNINRFLVMIKKIASYQTELFSEIPFEKYLFLVKISPQDQNGTSLEHWNSTEIFLTKRKMLQNMKDAANIIAHEFFQSWNSKRLHPAVLEPFDYTRESRTKCLWFCEGVTSYYADLTLIRTKIWAEQEFLEHQAKLIEKLQENPDRLITSVEQASLHTWENGLGTPGIFYNIKGQLIGLLLDLSIREFTNNKFSLDDLMRFMNWWFAKNNIGYGEEDIQRAVNSLTFHDFSDFFNKYVSGTVELPYEEVFNYAGILIEIKKDTVPDLGLLKIIPPKNKVTALDETGPLAKAGLKKGDYVQGINGQSIRDIDDIHKIVESLNTDVEVQVTVEREGVRLNLYAVVDKKAKITARLKFLPKPSERQLRIRRAWLEGVIWNENVQ